VARFAQVTVDGLAMGSIYAALAVALVLTFRSTGVVNFAQGEMAMFCTFVGWTVLHAGVPLAGAFVATLAFALVAGAAIERVAIRPVEGRDPLTVIILTLGLYILVNAAAGWIWGFDPHAFPSVFPGGAARVGGVRLAVESLGQIGVLLAVVAALAALLARTKVGLVMRAVAVAPESARLVGVPVGRVLMLGWGLAALVGAIAGLLVVPQLFLDVNVMGGVLIYAFAAATLGGFDSLLGAVLGGWIVGVTENWAGTYVGFIGSDLKILVPLAVLLVVLLVRPSGLLGSREVVRA
jgi:branched-chain amino acid transport system permease protein